MGDQWRKIKKGLCGIVYVHPELERAIFDNQHYGKNPGIFYEGKKFKSVEAAKTYAERVLPND